MPGAAAVSKAEWIHVTSVTNAEELAKTKAKMGLGASEVSTVFLATEIRADLTLMDEWKGSPALLFSTVQHFQDTPQCRVSGSDLALVDPASLASHQKNAKHGVLGFCVRPTPPIWCNCDECKAQRRLCPNKRVSPG
jgi:hypothetical protein